MFTATAVTGLHDPRTSSVDPSTGFLYTAQQDNNIAAVAIVRTKPWGPLPTALPTCQPTNQPSMQPSTHPSEQPTQCPTTQPTQQPLHLPTQQPSSQPTRQPSSFPSRPSSQPSMQPSVQPVMRPSGSCVSSITTHFYHLYIRSHHTLTS